MSEFCAYFPTINPADPVKFFNSIEPIFRSPLGAKKVTNQVAGGVLIARAEILQGEPQLYLHPAGLGWLLIKGIIIDPNSKKEKDPTTLLNVLLHENYSAISAYEGTFALIAWNEGQRQCILVNDQASMLNLYYSEQKDGLYVSTKAIVLAHFLSLPLDAAGVQEFLARGTLFAPTTLFKDIKRLDVGEHVIYKNGSMTRKTHWTPYVGTTKYRNTNEASEATAYVIKERIDSYARQLPSIICDLTAGVDSRIIVSALHASGRTPVITVNGPEVSVDVRIAKQIGQEMDWETLYFNTLLFWNREVTPEMRQQLVYATGGDLPFTAVYHQLLSRPTLADRFQLHLSGAGGEFLRYASWGQEFLGIGRRRFPNINNLLTYVYLKEDLSPRVFPFDWLPSLRARLALKLRTIFSEQPDALTTQHLDAAHIWWNTSHSSVYISSVFSWLPSAAPFLTSGVLSIALGIPWWMRLTSQLQRKVAYHLSPEIARFPTRYGATMEPTGIRNLHLAARQSYRQALDLAGKLDRVLLKGSFSRLIASNDQIPKEAIPFLTPELKKFLEPASMNSRNLYFADGIEELFSQVTTSRRSTQNESLLARIATVEQLCRELNFTPDAHFLKI